jgi:alpha-N-arabinofuranosidase
MTVPDVDVSATRADDGSLRIAVVNRHRDAAVRLRIVLDGAQANTPATARIRALGADAAALDAVNTLGAPDTIAVRDLGDVESSGGAWTVAPHSVTVLSL